MYISIYHNSCVHAFLSLYHSVILSLNCIYLSIYLSTYLSIYLSIYRSE